MDLSALILESRGVLRNSLGTAEDLLNRVAEQNVSNAISVTSRGLEDVDKWSFDATTGNYGHESGKFFSIQGLSWEQGSQPIIVQPEVGILGILCRKSRGVLELLIQLKAEPGNENGIQMSPTVQATKSNYSLVHGGKPPVLLEYFTETGATPLFDALLSEQGWRYYQKRNRNCILLVNSDLEAPPGCVWITLGQLETAARVPLLLNACLRSVLSLLPKVGSRSEGFLSDAAVGQAIQDFRHRNAARIPRLVPLRKLGDQWSVPAPQIQRKDGAAAFRVIGIGAEADRREVSAWHQPLLEERGAGEYGLVVGRIGGVVHIFWRLSWEPGSPVRGELAPSWVLRSGARVPPVLPFESGTRLLNIPLAEEGGRFYRSSFHHMVLDAGEIEGDSLGPEFLPLTAFQTQTLMSSGSVFGIEARSLWCMCKRTWFE